MAAVLCVGNTHAGRTVFPHIELTLHARLTNEEERNGPPESAPESHIFRAGVIPTSVCLTTYNGGPEDFMLTPLDELVEQVAAGTLRAQIDRVFKLDDIVEAHRCTEENKASGKIVVLT